MAELKGLNEELGLSVLWSDPLASSRSNSGTFGPELVDYSHEMADMGGFYSASLSVAGDKLSLEEWLQDGLARHIEVRRGNFVVWEGFVNRATLSLGGTSVGRGDVVDLANQTLASYTRLNTAATPPTTGPAAQLTALTTDVWSQAYYGTWEKWVEAGTCQPADATRVRNIHLAEAAWPGVENSYGEGGQVILRLDCLGYWAYFLAYTYEELAVSGTRQVDLLIQDVISADPNGIFSLDFSNIAANAWATARWEQSGTSAWEYLKHLVSLGDANDVPYTLGVYEGRKVRYQPITTTVEYLQYVTDPGRKVYRYQGGAEVAPWRVRPAQWLVYNDLLVGSILPTALTDMGRDARLEFLRSVQYRAPWGLIHSGRKVNRLDQALAQLSLGGTS